MIWLFADILAGLGGIETYLDALARTLHAEQRPFKIAVSLNGSAPFLHNLEELGVDVYRQRPVPGDRFKLRQRLLVRHVARQLRPGDWVYCVRQPMPEIYLSLVRAVHARGAKVAASWIFVPEFVPLSTKRLKVSFCRAVAETDAVFSVSECSVGQYREIYGYNGPVRVVRYHNRPFFDAPVPLPPAPPYNLAFMGRIDIRQKNLDTILEAFALVREQRQDVVMNFYGGGPDETRLAAMVDEAGLGDVVTLHGRYAHDRDLGAIVGDNHVFVYTSRFEGGPCLTLLELMQAGRYVVASPVGGIPDLYQDRLDLGLLVPPDSAPKIAIGLLNALADVENGRVNGVAIRERYKEAFSNEVAHCQFVDGLELEKYRYAQHG